MGLNTKQFEIGMFIQNGVDLLEVQNIKKLGKYPNTQRIVVAENCMTLIPISLTEYQVREFNEVIPCSDPLLSSAVV